MKNWAEFGYTGMVWGLILCAVTVPLLAVAQKVFRQRLRLYWLVVCAAVTVYLTGVFAFTMMPLSSASQVVCSNNPVQLVPFASVYKAVSTNTSGTFIGLVTSYNFLQIAFNVLMFMPWGFMARAVFKRPVMTSTLTAFAGSLLIETTQLTGFWGIYPCGYRIFDVDDLITNTLGGLVGALVAVAWVRIRRRPEQPLRTPAVARPSCRAPRGKVAQHLS